MFGNLNGRDVIDLNGGLVNKMNEYFDEKNMAGYLYKIFKKHDKDNPDFYEIINYLVFWIGGPNRARMFDGYKNMLENFKKISPKEVEIIENKISVFQDEYFNRK